MTSDRSGYVQEIDRAALVRAASRVDAVVHVLHRPGQFVLGGEALASVHPAGRLRNLEDVVRREVTLGRHRTLHEDFEFGIAQIVEIGIRALSPAVNDTFTGVYCVDWLGDALLVVADAPAFDGRCYDADGKLRVSIRPLRLERLVRLAFDQMRQAASDNPAVLIRILDTLRRIAPRLHGEGPARALMDEARAVRDVGAAQVIAALDREDVEAAWQRLAVALGQTEGAAR